MNCSELLPRFENLRRAPGPWTSDTLYRAPHKPLLLLALLDVFAQGSINSNFIQYSVDLIDTFELYWLKVIGPERKSSWILPFYHLHNDGFWQLIPVPGMENALKATRSIKSIRQLEQLVVGARLDDALFQALTDDNCRDIIRRFLIEHYFAPEVRPILVDVGKIVSEAFQYSLELYSQTKRRFVLKEDEEASEGYAQEPRSAAFRKVVIAAYDHQCALCGLRLLTPEGRTAVEAAHIVPWSHSHNDDPRNGLALCGVHHWAFDQGLLGVSKNYVIAVSPIVAHQGEVAAPIYGLADRQLVLPREKSLLPAKKALEWHYENTFRPIVHSYLL